MGTLVTGWSKGGKTELLMAAAGAGARYIGDEWVYLTTDGRMHGIPEPIRLWDWHLRQLPVAREQLTLTDRLKLGGIPALRRLERATPRQASAACRRASCCVAPCPRSKASSTSTSRPNGCSAMSARPAATWIASCSW